MHEFLRTTSVLLALTVPAAAQGDDCGGATPISGEGIFAFDNTGASSSFQGCNGSSDVFWLWTAPGNGRYLIEFNGFFHGTLGVFRQPHCAFTEEVDCNLFDTAPGGVRINDAVQGEQFLVQVSGFFRSDMGAGELLIRRPPCEGATYVEDGFEDNDTIGSATPVTVGVYPGLTIAVGDQDWYSFTIPAGMRVEANVEAPIHQINSRLLFANGTSIVEQVTGAFWDPASSVPIDVVLALTKGNSPFPSQQCATYDLNLQFFPTLDSRFDSFCMPAEPNSTGFMSNLFGFVDMVLFPGEVVLRVWWGPPNQIGFFLASASPLDPGVPFGSGRLCLGTPVGRYLGPGTALHSVGQFSSSGTFENTSGTGWSGAQGFVVPQQLPGGFGQIMPGQTWYFQFWHRDVGGTLNFSNGLSFLF